jgi:hypothetical protein
MIRPPAPIITAFLLSISFVLVACNSGNMNMAMVRQLQTISVTPQSANAQNFANKQVQFTATGTYTMAPMSGMPQVRWSIGNPFSTMPVPAGVTIDQNGMAQCTTFSGTVTITATAPMDPGMPLSQMTMMTGNVSGMAQLMCP